MTTTTAPSKTEEAKSVFDPKNPNAILKLDFNYDNLVGPEFDRYLAYLEELCPEMGIHEHTNTAFNFELYHAKPIRKPRYEGVPGSPIDFIGIKLKEFEGPLRKTRITIKIARDLNQQITNPHSLAGNGTYYLLKQK